MVYGKGSPHMFGTALDLGFTIADIQGQVSGFLGNAVVAALIGTALALVLIPRIISVVKGTLRH